MAEEISLELLARRKGIHEPQQENGEQEKPFPGQLTRAQREQAEELKSHIDLLDSQAVLLYGTGIQRNLSGFSSHILERLRAYDNSNAGRLLTELIVRIKEVGIEELEEEMFQKTTFWGRASRAVRKLTERYEKIELQIDHVEQELELARMQMLRDITILDGMYERNLEYLQELQIYIVAGEEKIQELREKTLPRLEQEAVERGDSVSSQLVKDFADTVGRFENKIYDLKLSRTMALQMLPQISLVQNSEKTLADKIQTAILHTIPLWKSQVILALGLQRQDHLRHLQKEFAEATGQLLTENTRLLRKKSQQMEQEAQKGTASLSDLKRVNEDLIAAIEDTVRIQKESRRIRQDVEGELKGVEEEFIDKISSWKIHGHGPR